MLLRQQERAQYGTLWNAPAVVRNREPAQEEFGNLLFFFFFESCKVGMTWPCVHLEGSSHDKHICTFTKGFLETQGYSSY